MKQKIVKDITKLSKPCSPVKSVERGVEVGEELLELLKQTENGVGLAANQVGMTQKVCVVNVEKPIILGHVFIKNSSATTGPNRFILDIDSGEAIEPYIPDNGITLTLS